MPLAIGEGFMVNERAFAQFTESLHGLLEETFEKVRGRYLDRGTSLYETLATISAEEASRPVSASCAPIAAQVEHLRCYLEMCARYGRGEQPGKIDWDATWQLRSVTPEEWEALQGRLRDTYRGLLAVLRTPATWESEFAIGGAMNALVHSAYHLGEIRQALCTIKG
jgi:hypothetical protein